MKRSLAEWASIAEIVASAAIVVSLIFVGLEIRGSARQTELNTEALAMNAYQALVGQISDISEVFIDYPEMNDLVLERPENLSQAEMARAINIQIMAIRHGDLAFYMHDLGMLSEERLQSSLGVLRANWCSPVFSDIVWRDLAANFLPAYREFVDHNIAENC